MQLSDIAAEAGSASFRQELVDLLVELCRIDTAIKADVAGLRQAEAVVFDVLTRYLDACAIDGGRVRRVPIDPRIEQHPFFSQLYYTRGPQAPEGLSVQRTYEGRANLVYEADGAAPGGGLAINAHIDTVQPFFGPRIEDGRVYGRGSCDDKGNVVAMVGALKLVSRALRGQGRGLERPLTAMLVIDEEMGGNGSLSMALDRELKARYDSLVVLEICENRIFPGNRGCVWYKVEARIDGANLFEAAAWVIEELEKEGRALRSESAHALFPHRPAQTCHGIIGNNGEHPSRINGEVAFDIVFAGGDPTAARGTVEDVIAFALAEYTGLYGDRTKERDAVSGRPKVDHHVDVVDADHGLTVTVHGSTGHMGAQLEKDGAITKMMTIVRALVRSREMLEARSGGRASLRQHGWPDPSNLVLEGGQGFLPTHEMSRVQARMRAAVRRGAAAYFLAVGGDTRAAERFTITFEKLHNEAFAGDPDSPDMRQAIACARAADMWRDEPIRGWDVSCDARIFAAEYPDLNVLTTGPGSLACAHSDGEYIEIDEMVKCAEFLAYYILSRTAGARVAAAGPARHA